jgi:hypothetical protein
MCFEVSAQFWTDISIQIISDFRYEVRATDVDVIHALCASSAK